MAFTFNPFTGNLDAITIVTAAAVGAAPNANGLSISGGSVITLQPFSSTQPGVVTASGGGSANFLRADGTWNIPPGTGANVTLSNLTNPTAINQDLILDTGATFLKTKDGVTSTTLYLSSGDASSFGSGGVQIKTGASGNQPSGSVVISTGIPSTGSSSGPIYINTGSPNVGQSGVVTINSGTNASNRLSGNVTLSSGATESGASGYVEVSSGESSIGGGTGTLLLKTGTTAGTRGKIQLQDGTQGTSGHIWTSTDIDGSGSWAAAGAAVTLSAVGSSPNANAATLTGQVLNLEPASSSFPGVVTTGTQNIAGAKTFTDTISVGGQLTSTVVTGTAPFVVSSTTQVANLNAATAGSATTATNIAGGLGGSVPYQTAVNTTALLANGTAGQVLTSAGTTLAPTWVTPTTGTVSSVGAIDTAAVANGLSISAGAISTQSASVTVPGMVNITTQSFEGAKTFTSDLIVNTVKVGLGNGSVSTNTAVGVSAAAAITGNNNAFIGYHAGIAATGTNFSTIIGSVAGIGVMTGANNTLVGYSTGQLITSATDNTLIGFKAGINSTANFLTAIGSSAASAAAGITGANNTFVGSASGISVTSGADNTAVGYTSHQGATGARNSSLGSQSLGSGATNLADSTMIGYKTGFALSNSSSGNTFVGSSAGIAATGTTNSVVVGAYAVSAAMSGTENVVIGYTAGNSITTTTRSTAVGSRAMGTGITTGGDNTAVGWKAGLNLAAGYQNTIMGSEAGSALTGGTDNTLIGFKAGLAYTGTNAVIIGSLGAAGASSASSLIAIGYATCADVLTGTDNIFIGNASGQLATSAAKTVAVGTSTGKAALTGANNVLIGFEAGKALTSGASNTFVGYQAGLTPTNISNSIGLGAGAVPTTSNTVKIGDGNITSNLLSGTASTDNFIQGYATTATAAGTTTLVVGSKNQQYFTGVTTQTVVLPVTSTLVLGQQYQIVNNSTGLVTVQSSGANNIQIMAANTTLLVTCILTSGTTAASWNAFYSAVGVPVITGTRASPSAIVAGTGVAFSGTVYHNTWFIEGSGGAVTVTANPQIVAGTTVGQELKLIGRNDTNTVTLANGTGLSLNGGAVLAADNVLSLFWDGTNWLETARTF